MEPGSLAEFTTLAIEAQGRLDTSWAAFLSINSAVIGGVVFIERKFKLLEKLLICIAYTALIILNYVVTKNSILQLTAIYEDLAKVKLEVNEIGHDITNHFSQIFDNTLFFNNSWFVPSVYIFTYILIILAIAFDERFTVTDN